MQWMLFMTVVAALGQWAPTQPGATLQGQFTLSEVLVNAVNAQLSADHQPVTLASATFTLTGKEHKVVGARGTLNVVCKKQGTTATMHIPFVISPTYTPTQEQLPDIGKMPYPARELTEFAHILFVEHDLRTLSIVYECFRDIALSWCETPNTEHTFVSVGFWGNAVGAAYAYQFIAGH